MHAIHSHMLSFLCYLQTYSKAPWTSTLRCMCKYFVVQEVTTRTYEKCKWGDFFLTGLKSLIYVWMMLSNVTLLCSYIYPYSKWKVHVKLYNFANWKFSKYDNWYYIQWCTIRGSSPSIVTCLGKHYNVCFYKETPLNVKLYRQ